MIGLSDKLNWLESNREYAYSFIRIFLGIALFIRGWILFSDPVALIKLAGSNQTYWWFSYIAVAHLVGGLFLALGLFTRFAALFQIPILVGAVLFVHLKQGLVSIGQSLELAVLVFVLLFIFFLFGSGIISVEKYIRKKRV